MFVGQVMCPHHPDQMSQRTQDSWIVLKGVLLGSSLREVDMTKTRQRHGKDTAKTRQRHDKDTTKTWQRHDTEKPIVARWQRTPYHLTTPDITKLTVLTM